jgi:hypothetical protein
MSTVGSTGVAGAERVTLLEVEYVKELQNSFVAPLGQTARTILATNLIESPTASDAPYPKMTIMEVASLDH